MDQKDFAHLTNLIIFLTKVKLEPTKTLFKSAISIDTDVYCALINLGIVCLQFRDRKQAQTNFRFALEKCPVNSVDNSLNKVTTLLGLERMKEALEILQRTRDQFKIQQKDKEEFFQDWNLLVALSEPPAGIYEFIEQAKEILSQET